MYVIKEINETEKRLNEKVLWCKSICRAIYLVGRRVRRIAHTKIHLPVYLPNEVKVGKSGNGVCSNSISCTRIAVPFTGRIQSK